MNWSKLNRVLHRELGFLFFGMTIIYCVSGIAINHLSDWNPNYDIRNETINCKDMLTGSPTQLDNDQIKLLLDIFGEQNNYKSHYYPKTGFVKIFLHGGSITVDLQSGEGVKETIKRRPVLNQLNFLHYNPARVWTVFSDVFAVCLIIIAITGLFLVKGKNGITGRGAWLTALGIIIPVIFIIAYF
ncbi:MAG TPA: PepSY-associated TM helix domain-containing protein [bacterium]|nr:PepSY-associated TM helix domain-containing protein [bacterium]HPN42906.1 PepSY-associated TM helix domain-containing protein [bacterium]